MYPWSLKFLPSNFLKLYFRPVCFRNFLFCTRASEIRCYALELLKFCEMPFYFVKFSSLICSVFLLFCLALGLLLLSPINASSCSSSSFYFGAGGTHVSSSSRLPPVYPALWLWPLAITILGRRHLSVVGRSTVEPAICQLFLCMAATAVCLSG